MRRQRQQDNHPRVTATVNAAAVSPRQLGVQKSWRAAATELDYLSTRPGAVTGGLGGLGGLGGIPHYYVVSIEMRRAWRRAFVRMGLEDEGSDKLLAGWSPSEDGGGL